MTQIFILAYVLCIFIMSNAFEIPFLFKQVEFLAGDLEPVQLHAKLLSYYNFAQVFFIILAGYLSDKFSRKKLLYISGIILVISILIQALATDINQLILARILTAVRAGAVVIVFASVGEIKKELRLKAMSYISAGFAIAYIIAPYISGVLVGSIDNLSVISNALYVNALISTTIFVAVYFLKASNSYKNIVDVKEYNILFKTLWFPVLILAMASFLMSGIETFMPPALYYISGTGQAIGTAFALLSITMAITEALLPWIFKFSKKNAIIGFFIVLIGFAFYIIADTKTMVFTSLILIAIGYGFIYPTIQTLISILTTESKQGFAFAIAQLFRVLFAGFANLSLAPYYASATNSASTVWLISSIIAGIIIIAIMIYPKNNWKIT